MVVAFPTNRISAVAVLIAFSFVFVPFAQGDDTGNVPAPLAPGFEDPVPSILDVTEYEDKTTTIPAHLPVPETAEAVGPGTYLLISRPDGTFICTANFLWNGGGTTYLGTAGHCLLPSSSTATHGPGADYDPQDTSVSACVSDCQFGGWTGSILQGTFVALGNVAYARQTGPGGVLGNDFGVVEVPSGVPTRASMPVWGGPTGDMDGLYIRPVCLFGNGVGVGEVWPTMGRAGMLTFHSNEGKAAIYQVPATFGDSGAAVVYCQPHIIGLDGTLALAINTHITAFGAAGTTSDQAKSMATEAGLSLTLITV